MVDVIANTVSSRPIAAGRRRHLRCVLLLFSLVGGATAVLPASNTEKEARRKCNEASQLMERQQYREAVEKYEDAQRLAPLSYPALFEYQASLRKIHRYLAGIRAGRLALELEPENAEAWLALGLTYLDTRAFAPARTAMEKSYELSKDKERALAYLRSLAYQLWDEGDLAGAGEMFRQILARGREKGLALIDLGGLEACTNDLAGGKARIQEGISLLPKDDGYRTYGEKLLRAIESGKPYRPRGAFQLFQSLPPAFQQIGSLSPPASLQVPAEVERIIDFRGLGQIRMVTPESWAESDEGRDVPTLRWQLTPKDPSSRMMVTFLPPLAESKVEELTRTLVEKLSAKSVEKGLSPAAMTAGEGHWVYVRAVDKGLVGKSPKPEEFKYVIQGIYSHPRFSAIFTIFTNREDFSLEPCWTVLRSLAFHP